MKEKFAEVKEEVKEKAKKLAVSASIACSSAAVMAAPVLASETTTTPATTGTFDGAALVEIVTSISSLFTIYPINLFMGFGLAAAGFGLFGKAKKAAK